MRESSWVDGFDYLPDVQSDASSFVIPVSQENNVERLKKFLLQHFIEDSADTDNPVYRLKSNTVHLSKDQMQQLITVCITHGLPNAHTATWRLLWPSWSAVKGNLPLPKSLDCSLENAKSLLTGLSAFCYQLLNSGVQMTGILTLIWELYPDYNPVAPRENGLIALPLTVISIALMRNTHYFVSAIADLDVSAIQAEMDAKKHAFLQQLPSASQEIYSLVTRPSMGDRLLHDICVIAAWVSAMAGDIALVLELLKDDPLWLRFALGVAVGIGDSLDAGNQAFISGMHRDFLAFHRNGQLPSKLADKGLITSVILKSSFVWQYFKLISPSLVVLLRGLGALGLLPILGAETKLNRSLLLGYQMIMFLSAMKYGFVFSEFSFNEVFTRFLDHDDFSYHHNLSLSTVSRASMGALPVTMMAWSVAHASGLDATKSTLYTALPAQLMLSLMLATMPRFANVYSNILECRFVENAWNQFGRIQKLDRAVLFFVGALMTTVSSVAKDNENLAYLGAFGLVLSFISALSLIGNISKNLMKTILFGTAETLYFGTALINWVLFTIIPLKKLVAHESLDDCPQTLDRDYFGLAAVVAITTLSLMAGLFVTRGDVVALLDKPRDQQDAATNDTPFETGVVNGALTAVSRSVSTVVNAFADAPSAVYGLFANRSESSADEREDYLLAHEGGARL